jgi:hypothetical protein
MSNCGVHAYRLERKGHLEIRHGLVHLSLFGAADERAVGR